MAASMATICISLGNGLVPVPWVPAMGAHHVCTWRHSIKGQVHLALCSLFGWMWLRSHLDLELDTSLRHSPDCQFTHHTLVNLSFHWQPTGQLTILSATSSGACPQQKSIKVTQNTSHTSTTTNMQVTIRLLAAHSPEYLVPLMAAVTHTKHYY